jgi:hypothetical protein
MVDAEMDRIRAVENAILDLAQTLFEQQFINAGGRVPGDATWDDLETGERESYEYAARDAWPLLAAKDAEIAVLRSQLSGDSVPVIVTLNPTLPTAERNPL